MAKAKKEKEIKTEELKLVNKINKEIICDKEMEIEVYHKLYKVSDLIKLDNKENKTYHEIEIVKMFKELMKNYYRAIVHATSTNSYQNIDTLKALKNKLKDKNTYELIDMKCTRSYIKFDKITVDTIINYIEKYEIK